MVAIIAVLAAVAIPAFQAYNRRSYVAEAQNALTQIKGAQEAFYALRGIYISAAPNPATLPEGNRIQWNPNLLGWAGNELNVRPDRFVRFQYQVWGTDISPVATAVAACAAGGACDQTEANAAIGTFQGDSSCFENPVGGAFVDFNYSGADDWYVIGARADLNASSDETTSLFLPIDETRIFECNAGE